MREREIESERKRESRRGRERGREKEGGRERASEKERDTERERERERKRERDIKREGGPFNATNIAAIAASLDTQPCWVCPQSLPVLGKCNLALKFDQLNFVS